MPNGRDSARGAGQRPRARRRYAGTPGRLGAVNKIHCSVNIAVLSNIDTDKLERQIVIGCRDRYRRNCLFRFGFD